MIHEILKGMNKNLRVKIYKKFLLKVQVNDYELVPIKNGLKSNLY